jgi:GT2 family glycosyltransferase
MESDKKIGITSSKILYFYEDNIIQYAGTSINFITRGRHYGNKEEDKQFNKSRRNILSTWCMYDDKKSVLEELGLLYEGYFLYYEEYDFTERVDKQDIKFISNPTLLSYIKNLFYGKNSS